MSDDVKRTETKRRPDDGGCGMSDLGNSWYEFKDAHEEKLRQIIREELACILGEAHHAKNREGSNFSLSGFVTDHALKHPMRGVEQ